MKRLLLFTLYCVIPSITLYAQLNLGIKQSIITYSNFTYVNPQGFDRSDWYQGMYSMNGGLLANYELTRHLSIQSELIFNVLGTNFYQNDSYTESNYGFRVYTSNHFKVRNYYLDIPLIAKFSFGNKVTFDVLLGSFVGCLLSARQSTEDNQLHWAEEISVPNSVWTQQKTTDYPPQNTYSKYSPFNAGLLMGLGTTFRNHMFLEVRITQGLVNIHKADPTKITTFQAQFSVGCYVFKQKKKSVQ